jgi:hypothetical protein
MRRRQWSIIPHRQFITVLTRRAFTTVRTNRVIATVMSIVIGVGMAGGIIAINSWSLFATETVLMGA